MLQTAFAAARDRQRLQEIVGVLVGYGVNNVVDKLGLRGVARLARWRAPPLDISRMSQPERAIAAERLRAATGGPVAILDIDVHHGNGTQGIFYDRPDVLTVSVHADPSDYFPFYTGYADERGTGAGEGFNRNLPLAQGSGDAPWLAAIEAGLAEIAAFRPAALVVALGFDASEHDPIGAFRVTTAGFEAAAALVAAAHPVTALVQEGGYLCDALPRNLAAFLRAFEAKRAG